MNEVHDRGTRSVAITSNTLAAGGAERQRVLLANALCRQRVDVTFYVLQAAGHLATELDPRVRLVPRHYRSGADRRHDLIVTGTTRTEIAFGFVTRSARRSPRWAVAVHNPIGTGARGISRVALAGSVIADELIALTVQHADLLARDWGLRASATISNAIDPAPFSSPAGSPPSYDVGFIGRLEAHHKGIDRLIRALAAPGSTATLAIAGVGPDEAHLRSLAARLGIGDRVSWLGFTRPQDFLRQVGVLGILSRYEAQPLVVLEAAAAGVPIVTSVEVGPAGRNPCVDADDAEAVRAALIEATGLPRVPDSAPRTPDQMADEYLALAAKRPRRSRIAHASVLLSALARGPGLVSRGRGS